MLVVDMTQRRQLENELEGVQRLELVGRIASGVVHDFNNMLTIISGYAQMARDVLSDHAAKKDVEHVLHATDQAKRLAGQLLTFSKKRKVIKRPVDLHMVTKRTLSLLLPAGSNHIEVELHGRENEAIVLADDTPLQQIVMNLCLNARDAMPQGGRLLVETACEEPMLDALAECPNGTPREVPGDADTEVRISKTIPLTAEGQRWARLTVADTGCGIDEVLQARIFEPLFTTKERGSGLGLAVVKQIVESLGGTIKVSSTPGQGTRFDVRLPLRTE